jgi:Reverse transcriptase (RNA-dependent DNA polymerase)
MWGGEKDACRKLGNHMADRWSQGLHIGAIDISNAFNEAERPVILDALVRAGASDGVMAYARHCLQPTTIVTPHGTHVANRGVVQGDPQAPTLFATLMAVAADEIATECDRRGVRVHRLRPHEPIPQLGDDFDIIVSWYADDGETAVRDVAHFATFLEVATSTLAKYGLRVGGGKSKVLAGKGRVLAPPAPGAGYTLVDTLCVVGVPIGPPEAARLLHPPPLWTGPQAAVDLGGLPGRAGG